LNCGIDRKKNMQRREFLQNTLRGALALAAARPGLALAKDLATNAPLPGAGVKEVPPWPEKLRGVNLGGWLVLEKWMVPDVFRGSEAPDEYSLCLELGDKAKARLDGHRETFITAEDFRWIRDCGLNAVRLPVGYWALEAPKPYVENWRFIDFALEQSRRNGLKLLLDLHGAPGSQNGWDHSGRSGPINWPKDPKNIEETLRVLETFAQKYGNHPALCGIEVLNEPRITVPLEILQQFYRDAHSRLRKRLEPRVAIVFHDSFRPFAWKEFMRESAFTNAILDTHLYQCFGAQAKSRTAREQLAFALDRNQTLDEMQGEDMPTMVGEWSLSLPGRATRGLSLLEAALVTRAYADTQLLNYEGTRGWFFWSYKLANSSEWNFRHCVERGWLPASFEV
jgi:glucan 1,3-beta-glucosidase